MKKVLSILAINNKFDTDDTALSEVEFFYRDKNEGVEACISRALKQALGKYILVTEKKFTYQDLYGLVKELNGSSKDMITSPSGTFFKTSICKNLTLNKNLNSFSFNFFSALQSKKIEKKDWDNIVYEPSAPFYDGDNGEKLLACAEEFNQAKSKLTKEIYTYTFDILLKELVEFYMLSMTDKDKNSRVSLVEFDKNLKKHIMFYVALEKRFPVESLSAMRKKQFKVSFVTAFLFKKHLNKGKTTKIKENSKNK
jgi:hypothetical protein